MDCKTARLLLDFDRPRTGDIDPAEHEALQAHVAECPDCGPLARDERRADHSLGEAMRDVSVPADLRARLLDRLQAARPLPARRRWPGRAAVVAALAAAVLLAVWYGLQGGRKSGVDLELASNELFFKTFNPQPATVEHWFRSRGVDTLAPPDFNYALLKYYGLDEYLNRRVPTLLFIRDNDKALVYILSDKQFDLASTAGAHFAGSGCTAILRRHPTDARVAYLIVYTGSGLDRFLAVPPAAAA